MANVRTALKKAHKFVYGWGWYATGLLGLEYLRDTETLIAFVFGFMAFIVHKQTVRTGSTKLDVAGWIIAAMMIPIALNPFTIGKFVTLIALIIFLDTVVPATKDESTDTDEEAENTEE